MVEEHVAYALPVTCSHDGMLVGLFFNLEDGDMFL
jgi:hypothetical protein